VKAVEAVEAGEEKAGVLLALKQLFSQQTDVVIFRPHLRR
jgi:hypothetical protein